MIETTEIIIPCIHAAAAEVPLASEPGPADGGVDRSEAAETTYTLDDIAADARAEQRDAELRIARDQPHDEAETQEAEGEDDPEAEEESERQAKPKLPKEQARSYSKDLMSFYAHRFGFDEDDLSDKRIRDIVKSKIDTDIFTAQQKAEIAALKDEQEVEEGDEEQDAEEQDQVENEEQETEQQRQQDQQQQEQQRADQPQPGQPLTEQQWHEHMQALSREAFDPRLNHPEAVSQYVRLAEEVFGADTPEAKANAAKIVNAVVLGTHSQMLSTVPLIVRQCLSSALDELVPGLREMHHEAAAANTWADLRESKKYGDLPAFGSPEFQEAAKKVYGENPWLDTITFRDSQGRPLSRNHPASMRQEAALVAKILSGEAVSPQTLAKAFERGKAEATRTQRRVSASRAMGSGRSAGGFGETSRSTSLIEAYSERHK